MEFKTTYKKDGLTAYAYLITNKDNPTIHSNFSDPIKSEILEYIKTVKPKEGSPFLLLINNEIYCGILLDKEEIPQILKAGAAAYKSVSKLNVKKLVLSNQLKNESFAEGAFLASFEFDALKKEKTEILEIEGESIEKTRIISECQNFCRFLSEAPANHVTPTKFVEFVRDFLKDEKNVNLIEKKRDFVEENKMGLFLSVANGSEENLRFLIIEYRGRDSEAVDVALVGKGITFDSGGISIKPSRNMEEMRFDMMGGATVVATLSAAAKLGVKLNIDVFVPLTENLPSGRATKPGDVHFGMNGKSVEINNTDAEGRLVLADALCYAQQKSPGVLIDVATLTGAIVVALGSVYAGLFSNSDELAGQLLDASKKSVDLMWRMPLDKRYNKDMESSLADLKNAGSGKGGSCSAASFLGEFVDHKKWAHIDIAGVMDNNFFCELFGKGASGAGMRTLIEFVMEEEKKLN